MDFREKLGNIQRFFAKRVTKCRETAFLSLSLSLFLFVIETLIKNCESWIFVTRIRSKRNQLEWFEKWILKYRSFFPFFFFFFYTVASYLRNFLGREFRIFFFSRIEEATFDRSFLCVDFYYRKCQQGAISFVTFSKACNWWREGLRIEALLLSRWDIDWYRVFLHVARIETFLFIARAKSEMYIHILMDSRYRVISKKKRETIFNDKDWRIFSKILEIRKFGRGWYQW